MYGVWFSFALYDCNSFPIMVLFLCYRDYKKVIDGSAKDRIIHQKRVLLFESCQLAKESDSKETKAMSDTFIEQVKRTFANENNHGKVGIIK